MSDSGEFKEIRRPGELEFIGRRGGEPVQLVPADVIAAVPAAKRAAEEANRDLDFDFLDDRVVLTMLRERHLDEEAMFKAGFKFGAPLAIVGFGAIVYWGGVAQYWESGRSQWIYEVAAVLAVLTLLFFFVRSAVTHWSDPRRQNLRARARRYREIAHIARSGGGDIPKRYPHYGPYPFAATFNPEVEESRRPEDEGQG
ncbi:hypothetical protein [Streptomyces sp. NBC_01014]|uniref:hypothetical protein n=1 Tax=Streptomyces sp. NBC_01014 TaxID=2903719 RepID=UPI00386D89D5|nr:hypothetical protein OG282_13455 [Streptomyces sp. NBC_01014]